MNFNEKVFGQNGKRLYTRGSPTSSAVTVNAMKSASTQVAQSASAQPQASGSAPVPSPTRAPASAQASASSAAIEVTSFRHLSSIDEVYGSIEQIDDAAIDWDEEYKALCTSESAPGDITIGSSIEAVNIPQLQSEHRQQQQQQQQQQQHNIVQRRAQVQETVFSAVADELSTLVVQQAGFGKTYMCMRLLSQLNFVIFLVPTNQLLEQMAADITQLGYPCKPWGSDDQSNGSALNIVSGNVCVVAIFDHMHELASYR